jgi:hypothetical protein
VTPPDIVAQAVEIAARIASVRVAPDAVAQLERPSYCMQALIWTFEKLNEDQMITPSTTNPKTIPITTGFFIPQAPLATWFAKKSPIWRNFS